MWRFTTFKIGGPADQLYLIDSVGDLRKLLKKIDSAVIIGAGSNILVSDKGIRDNVVITTGMHRIDIDKTDVTCECGAELKTIAAVCAENSLTGFEFASGIPGSIGGAVYMNAGAYGSSMSDVIKSVEVLDFDGNSKIFTENECEFDYRHSIFQTMKCIICRVTLHLSTGNKADIYTTMNELQQRRQSKQPLEYPSAGSVFRRPVGYYAGTLIEQAGLKGVRVGGAQVSEKHAGFIINTGDATAKDVLDLIKLVQKRVYEVHGVHLTPEIKFIGEP